MLAQYWHYGIQLVHIAFLDHGWFMRENCCRTECCNLKRAGIPRVCDPVVIVLVGWSIILLHDSDSEDWCSFLAKFHIKRLNHWSRLLLCSGISLGIFYIIPLLDTSYKSYCLIFELFYV